MTDTLKNKAEPFLKWVGGKRKVASHLIQHIPSGLSNYYEPFLGGGALFFQVKHKFRQAFLSDINLDLITSYNAVKSAPEKVVELLQEHENNHSKEYYYHVRNTNNSNKPTSISARFLYLNRHTFKGIYKLNKEGNLSSSFSTRIYATSTLPDRVMRCSSFLTNTLIFAGDFSFIEPKEDDFVYFDPPYHKSGEKFYTRLPFDESEQIRLRDFAKQLDVKGVKFMLSNSDTEVIRDLYKDYNIRIVEVKYDIQDKKRLSKEVVVTNY